MAWFKRWAHFFIAGAAIAYVIWKFDMHAALDAFRRAPIALFVVFSAALLLVNLAADTFAMYKTFGWFGCRVPYWDLFFVRGATYLVAIVNYHVGQAAVVGYLYKAQKVPFLRATGWILFIIGVNVGTLFLLASGGALQATGELRWMRWVPVVCVAGVVVYAALLVVKPRVLAQRALLAPLFEMGIVGHIKGVLVRLPHVIVLLVWHTLSLRWFGMDIPWTSALLYLPAYFAISSLPVNVNGIGVAQLVAVMFFAPFAKVQPGATNVLEAQRAAVIAYSLGTSGISILLQIVLGLVCLKRGGGLGGLGERDNEQAEAAAG
jgi:hypothetical protein